MLFCSFLSQSIHNPSSSAETTATDSLTRQQQTHMPKLLSVWLASFSIASLSYTRSDGHKKNRRHHSDIADVVRECLQSSNCLSETQIFSGRLPYKNFTYDEAFLETARHVDTSVHRVAQNGQYNRNDSLDMPLPRRRNITLLIIGDSVDRFSVEEWCDYARGSFCPCYEDWESAHIQLRRKQYPHCNRIDMKNSTDAMNFTKMYTVASCTGAHVYDAQVTLIFFFNRLGLRGTISCRKDSNSLIYHNNQTVNKILISSENNFTSFENAYLISALQFLEEVFNTTYSGILYQSNLWDMSYVRECNSTLYEKMLGNTQVAQNARVEWVSKWAINYDIVIKMLKERFPRVDWFGIRTSNPIEISKSTKDWFNIYGHQNLHLMNNYSIQIAESNKVDIVDFFFFPRVHERRDRVHPNPFAGILLVEHFVVKTLNSSSCSLGDSC